MVNRCIEVFDETYLNDIVSIHLEAFPGFFLTLLGKPFLTELYRGFIDSNEATLWVSFDESGRVNGFAAGTINPESFFIKLRNKKFLSFLIASLKAMILNPVVVMRKLFSAIFYNGDKVQKLDGAALLSSIGVRPNNGSKGVGTDLLQCFENFLINKKIYSVYLITDKNDNEKVINFYKRHNYKIDSTIMKSDGRSMYRLLKILQG